MCVRVRSSIPVCGVIAVGGIIVGGIIVGGMAVGGVGGIIGEAGWGIWGM